MQPTSPCTSAGTETRATPHPRFWRITFADLVSLWGEEQAEEMLDAMQRAYDRQEPTLHWASAYPDPYLN